MALETLKDVKEIGGFEVLAERPKNSEGKIDWELFDEQRKTKPIYVDHDVNMISFRIQNGPIGEVGQNGCQVDTLIETAKIMIEKLNEKFPCWQNTQVINNLGEALNYLNDRQQDREARGVEGTSES